MPFDSCRLCKKPVGRYAKTCAHCDALNPSGHAPSKRPEPSNGSPLGAALIFTALLVGFVLVAVANNEPEYRGEIPAKARAAHSPIAAYVMCQQFVEDRLRAPSTADFPWTSDGSVHLGEGKYRVQSYVDAENAFGGTVRAPWDCTIQYTGGDNWRLESLDM